MNTFEQPMPPALTALFQRWQPAGADASRPALEAVFSAGHTNRNFLVRYGNERMVVRLPDADQHAFGLDRAAEQRILAHIATSQLCAPVLFCEPASGILVTRYLASRALRFDGPSADRTIDRLADVLARLHGMRLDVPTISLSDRIRHYLRELSRRDPRTRSRARRWSDACSPVLEQYMLSARRTVLCHNDLVASNILDLGPRLCLIDWEYAGMGDPFFDLAAVTEEHGFKSLDRERLLLAYGEPGPESHEQLYRARVIHRLLSVLWYLLRRDGSRQAEQLTSALQRHEKALQALLTNGPAD